ncbi:hypothetical protein ACFL6Y_11325 [Elusimicrobiota bacterium]
MTIFAKTLIELRKEAGFATAHQFYSQSGGKKALGISYAKYLLLEQGKNLPRFERLKLFLNLLNIFKVSPKARRLVLAWLRTMTGEKDFRELLFPHIISENVPVSASSPAQDALRASLREKTYHMTNEQTDAIAQTPDNYWCFNLLANNAGQLKINEIAKLLGIKLPKVKKALKRLTEVKLTKEIKKGVFKSPLVGMSVELPAFKTLSPQMLGNIRKYRDSKRAHGEIVFDRTGVIRADSVALSSFFSYLNNNMMVAKAYETAKKTENTAFFLIEGKVTKLFKF